MMTWYPWVTCGKNLRRMTLKGKLVRFMQSVRPPISTKDRTTLLIALLISLWGVGAGHSAIVVTLSAAPGGANFSISGTLNVDGLVGTELGSGFNLSTSGTAGFINGGDGPGAGALGFFQSYPAISDGDLLPTVRISDQDQILPIDTAFGGDGSAVYLPRNYVSNTPVSYSGFISGEIIGAGLLEVGHSRTFTVQNSSLDTLLFRVIPEPSPAIALGLAFVFGLLRRKRFEIY